jgi:hypothetical protein
MPAKPEADWTQVGWKVWVYNDPNIEVYSSKTHTWDQVPQDGVQFMFRYYTKGTRSWREGISGQDFYLEKDLDKNLLPRVSTFFKIGSLDTNHYRLATENAMADTTYTVDDSISKYIDNKKTLIGWKAWVVENDQLVEYNSDLYNWSQVPPFGMVRLNKYWKSGNNRWLEHISLQDIYYLDNDDQSLLKSSYNFLKNGAVIDEAKLNEITLLAYEDPERIFS